MALDGLLTIFLSVKTHVHPCSTSPKTYRISQFYTRLFFFFQKGITKGDTIQARASKGDSSQCYCFRLLFFFQQKFTAQFGMFQTMNLEMDLQPKSVCCHCCHYTYHQWYLMSIYDVNQFIYVKPDLERWVRIVTWDSTSLMMAGSNDDIGSWRCEKFLRVSPGFLMPLLDWLPLKNFFFPSGNQTYWCWKQQFFRHLFHQNSQTWDWCSFSTADCCSKPGGYGTPGWGNWSFGGGSGWVGGVGAVGTG